VLLCYYVKERKKERKKEKGNKRERDARFLGIYSTVPVLSYTYLPVHQNNKISHIYVMHLDQKIKNSIPST
jgi:hypothetical protein